MNPVLHIEPLQNWIPVVKRPLIISGPCGAETREQLLKTAAELAELNAVHVFRAGIWKPRTRPNSFEGAGRAGLKWLREVKEKYGYLTAVEVANAKHVEQALKEGVDILWIGARTTGNPFSVQEIADVLRGSGVAVMVKNPIHPDLQLWIGALERVNQAGINRIIAVHRGFYTHVPQIYRNPPHWEIPIELKTYFPDIPIICDPSHICGNRELLPEISQKALDLNFDGLMLEAHFDPDRALSDSQQQLKPKDLGHLLSNLVVRSSDCKSTEFTGTLSLLRKKVDQVDEEIIHSLAQRMELIDKIGDYKKENNLTVLQLERWLEILRTRSAFASSKSVDSEFIQKIFQLIHKESIRRQTLLMQEGVEK